MSRSDDDGVLISVRNVTKHYHLNQERSNVRRLVPGRFGEVTTDTSFQSVHDVTFDVRRGESVGIIGHNGAGKTTILKMLAGIVEPTEGTIRVNGTLSALIEVGAAFESSLTGKENIFFAAGLLGLSRSEIEARYDSIVEFAGIEHFLGMPVKRYSTGMKARLGFAVATCIQPDLLIVDEILSVGDFAFQRKSYERIRSFHANGTTLVLVSHSIWMVEQLCDRLLLLDQGELVMNGAPSDVIKRYVGPNVGPDPAVVVDVPVMIDYEPARDSPVSIDEIAATPTKVTPNEAVSIVAKISVRRPTTGILVMSLSTSGHQVFAERDPGPSEFLLEEGTWTVTGHVPHLPLSSGSFTFRFAILPEDSPDPEQRFESALAIGECIVEVEGLINGRPGLCLATEWDTVLDTAASTASDEGASAPLHDLDDRAIGTA